MNNNMKRILITLLALMVTQSGWAQEQRVGKRVESNLMFGGGLFLETGSLGIHESPGAALQLSYGLDVRLNEHWSVMPGAGVRAQRLEINHIGWIGGDPDGMGVIDFSCLARYHFHAEGTDMVVGLGPLLSLFSQDTYYIDADPWDPLNSKAKWNRWWIGLKPSLVFQTGKHWQWGLEANIGLRNQMRQYPEYHKTGGKYCHNLMVTCGWRF